MIVCRGSADELCGRSPGLAAVSVTVAVAEAGWASATFGEAPFNAVNADMAVSIVFAEYSGQCTFVSWHAAVWQLARDQCVLDAGSPVRHS